MSSFDSNNINFREPEWEKAIDSCAKQNANRFGTTEHKLKSILHSISDLAQKLSIKPHKLLEEFKEVSASPIWQRVREANEEQRKTPERADWTLIDTAVYFVSRALEEEEQKEKLEILYENSQATGAPDGM